MRIVSEFYEETLELSNSDLERVFDLYEQYCDDNFQNPDCSKDEFIEMPEMFFDHVLYHAEIQDKKFVNDLIHKNRI